MFFIQDLHCDNPLCKNWFKGDVGEQSTVEQLMSFRSKYTQRETIIMSLWKPLNIYK